MKKLIFTKKEAASVLGIRPRTIQFYTDEKILIPEIANPSGRGTTRKYSRKNLMEILIIKNLSKKGLTLAQITNIMAKAREASVDLKWDPEGEWGKMELNKRAVLILYHRENGDTDIEMSAARNLSVRLRRLHKYDMMTLVNIENLYIQIDEI
ncbi:MAG: MerR family transcriptional regulator [Deltaproteobacteria bacterium]|nr:MerR family transcriptional regulator [Deltaproteobacteria bacterium]